MIFEDIHLSLKDIIFYNDRHAIKDNLQSYDLISLKRKVDEYIDFLSRGVLPNNKIALVSRNDVYFVIEQPLDLAIAKVVNSPFLTKSFTPFYEYIIEKTKIYRETMPGIFNNIQAEVSDNLLDVQYINVDDIDFYDRFDEERLISGQGFPGLLRRTAKRTFEKLIVVRYNQEKGRYYCIKNGHILYAHKVLSHLEEYRDKLSEEIFEELLPYSSNPFYRKIRCDESTSRLFSTKTVRVDDIAFYSMEDIYYHYIYEHPDIFLTLTRNIIEKGFYPIDVNGYLREDGKLITPYSGVYQILALKAIFSSEKIGRVFPEIQAMIDSYPDRKRRDSFHFSYNKVIDESLADENLIKVAGVLASIEEVVEQDDVEAVDVKIDEEAIDPEQVDEDQIEQKDRFDTVEIRLEIENDVIDKIGAPIKYGRTSLSLDELEPIDFQPFLAKGIGYHLKKEILEFLTMKEKFPVLKAIPIESGYYRVNPIDHKYLFIKHIHLHPVVIRNLDPSLYSEIITAKQFYDVKKTLKFDVKVASEEKSKKGNIFHQLSDGKLNLKLLKKDRGLLTEAEMIELSVILDKDILERFNPVKDPVIFYRTVRAFLECLLHLYYLHLDEENIYHDSGAWSGKFKPLSAWISMYSYIEKNLDCSARVFPPEIWQALNDSLRMDIVFILNNITHIAASADNYQEECRDFLWQSASLEILIDYILNNFRG